MLSNESSSPLPVMSIDVLLRHVAANDVFLLDLRNKGGRQIYGAIRYDPKKLLAAEKLVLPLPRSGGTIVLYDDDASSSHVRDIGERLQTSGYATVYALEGGFKAYLAANGRLEEQTLEQPVPFVSEHQLDR